MAARAKPKPRNAASAPASWEIPEAYALQALGRGEATADEQKQALNWIIMQACATYEVAYTPGADDGRRDTDFMLGRQFVGQQIVGLLKVDTAALTRRKGNV